MNTLTNTRVKKNIHFSVMLNAHKFKNIYQTIDLCVYVCVLLPSKVLALYFSVDLFFILYVTLKSVCCVHKYKHTHIFVVVYPNQCRTNDDSNRLKKNIFCDFSFLGIGGIILLGNRVNFYIQQSVERWDLFICFLFTFFLLFMLLLLFNILPFLLIHFLIVANNDSNWLDSLMEYWEQHVCTFFYFCIYFMILSRVTPFCFNWI